MSCENDQCSVLGYYADGFVGTGKFYVATASEFPYCGDQYMFEMQLSNDSPKTAGEISLDLDRGAKDSYSVKITPRNQCHGWTRGGRIQTQSSSTTTKYD